MDQIASAEDDSSLASQEISNLLWNLKVLSSLPVDSVLIWMNPFHIFTDYFYKIHFNIIH
jgi:hypothetical protein